MAIRPRAGLLVADDEDGVRCFLSASLGRAGYRVWLAASGAEAVELHRLHAGAIDAALLDVVMPGLDGPGVAAALLAARPDLPFAFMTAYPGQYAHDDLTAVGAAAVLYKPFRVEALLALVGRLTGGGSRP